MKTRISIDEWKEVEDRSSACNYFLENKRFEFIVGYLKTAIKEIEQLILTNKITSVSEVLTIGDRFKKIFKTEKKVQVDELIGQYKILTQFFQWLTDTKNLKDSLEKQESDNKIIIERSKESV